MFWGCGIGVLEQTEGLGCLVLCDEVCGESYSQRRVAWVKRQGSLVKRKSCLRLPLFFANCRKGVECQRLRLDLAFGLDEEVFRFILAARACECNDFGGLGTYAW